MDLCQKKYLQIISPKYETSQITKLIAFFERFLLYLCTSLRLKVIRKKQNLLQKHRRFQEIR